MRLREDALKAWEEDGDNHNNEMKEIGGKKLRCFKNEEENQWEKATLIEGVPKYVACHSCQLVVVVVVVVVAWESEFEEKVAQKNWRIDVSTYVNSILEPNVLYMLSDIVEKELLWMFVFQNRPNV